MDDACAGSRARKATAARRSRFQCLIDAVVAAPVLVASSVNLDDSANATQIVVGDVHDHVSPHCVADRGGAGVSPLRRADTRR
jgi:hypothetical protein